MTAREKFKIGQLVRQTADCYNGRYEGRTGRVVGFSHDPMLVRIVKTGTKTVASWSAAFWEPVFDEVDLPEGIGDPITVWTVDDSGGDLKKPKEIMSGNVKYINGRPTMFLWRGTWRSW